MSNNIKTAEELKQKDNGLKAQAKVLNNVALEVGGDLVQAALKSGKFSQEIFGKVLNGGITIFGMQQDLVLSALEQVAERASKNEKLQKAMVVPTTYFNRFKKTTEATTEKMKDTAEEVKETLNGTIAEVKETLAAKATQVKATLTNTAEEVKEEAVKAVNKVTADAGVITVSVEKDDLKKIDGIGPKMAEILNEAGIITFAQIAKSNTEELEAILAEAGSQYKKFNPAPWIEQAKFAAVEDWDGLKVWQEEN